MGVFCSELKSSKHQDQAQENRNHGHKEQACGNHPPGAHHTKQNIEPLSPVACALALLPRHGQMAIPKPLQHLMDVGSPIEDMFDECPVRRLVFFHIFCLDQEACVFPVL